MRIEVDKIDEPVKKITAEFEPGEFDLGEEPVVLRDKIRFEGTLEKHIYRVDIEGSIKAKAEIICSRCIIPVETELTVSFKSSFVPAEFETQEKEIEVKGDDLDMEFYEGDEIDLTELVREQIILNLPQTNLCRPDCRGLCEKCGINKNEKTCDCSEREIDPRLKVLENLVTEEKDDKR
jgi:uncharacterized protein